MGKTIAIIPARKNSKRLPGKNFKIFQNLPLFVHSILYARANSDIIDETYVSTNDPLIKKVALEYGVKVIDRPEKFSEDTTPTIDAVKHTLDVLITDDIENIVLLQPTNPLRPKDLLREAYEKFKAWHFGSLVTVSATYKKLGKVKDSKFIPFTYQPGQRNQDLEEIYYEDGLLIIVKKELVLKNILFNQESYAFVVEHPFNMIDIDTEEDFKRANFMAEFYKRNKE